MQIAKKIIVPSLLLVFAANLITIIYLDEYFYRNRPRVPNPAAKQVYALDIHHGARVYVTRSEKLQFDYFPIVEPIVFCAAFLLNRYWKVLPRATPPVTSSKPTAPKFRALVIAVGGAWCLFIAGSTIGERLLIDLNGSIAGRSDANGPNRPGAIYTIIDSDGKPNTYVTGPTDASLPHDLPVGAKISKQKWHLSYVVDGRTLNTFPITFYGVLTGIGLSLLAFSATLAIQQHRAAS